MASATRKQQAISFTLSRMEDALTRETELEMYLDRAKTDREREQCRVLASVNREIYRVDFHTLQLWHDLPPRFFDGFADDHWDKLDQVRELER